MEGIKATSNSSHASRGSKSKTLEGVRSQYQELYNQLTTDISDMANKNKGKVTNPDEKAQLLLMAAEKSMSEGNIEKLSQVAEELKELSPSFRERSNFVKNRFMKFFGKKKNLTETKLTDFAVCLDDIVDMHTKEIEQGEAANRAVAEPPNLEAEQITLTKAEIVSFRALYEPLQPGKMTYAGIKRTLSNISLRKNDNITFLKRKSTKLLFAVDTFEQKSWGSGLQGADFNETKSKFKTFLLKEAERYKSQNKKDQEQFNQGMDETLATLLERVNEITEKNDGLGIEFQLHTTGHNITCGDRSYQIGSPIAAGSAGTVKTATIQGSDKEVVVKEMYVNLMGQEELPRLVKAGDVALEILNERALRQADGSHHPRLADTLDAVVTKDENEMVRINIFMEKLGESGQEIAEELQSKEVPKREVETKKMLHQVSEGLTFIHSKNMIHRDIKPANIAKRGDDYVILDFGEVGRTDSHPSEDTTVVKGSAFFRAPEVMKASDDSPYSNAADIFSLGVTAFQLIAGPDQAPAFSHLDDYPRDDPDNYDRDFDAKRLNLAFNKAPWGDVSTEFKSLIKSMLDINPENRPSAAEISRKF